MYHSAAEFLNPTAKKVESFCITAALSVVAAHINVLDGTWYYFYQYQLTQGLVRHMFHLN